MNYKVHSNVYYEGFTSYICSWKQGLVNYVVPFRPTIEHDHTCRIDVG